MSLLDVAHRLNVNATFQLPFGDGPQVAHGSGVGNALLGGWSVTVAGRYQTGFPLNISQSSNNSGLLGSKQRPNLCRGRRGDDHRQPGRARVTGWINPAAFTPAPAFTFGNAPRTNPDWRGPGQRTTDLAISKTQRFGAQDDRAARRRAEPVRRPAVHRTGHHVRHLELRADHAGRRLRAFTAVPGPGRLVSEIFDL